MPGQIHFDDINLDNDYGPLKSYRQSKLANVLFSRELATRLKGLSTRNVLFGPANERLSVQSSHMSCRYRGNSVQSTPWCGLHRADETPVDSQCPVEADLDGSLIPADEDSLAGSSDHHLLCRGGEHRSRQRSVLQVSFGW